MAIDIHQFDITAIRSETRTDFILEDLHDLLHTLHIGHYGLRSGIKFLQLRLPQFLIKNILNGIKAFSATTASLGVVGNLFHRLEVVFLNGTANLNIGHTKTLADQFAFMLMLLLGGFAAPVTQSSFQGFLSHNGAMHLFTGQSTKVCRNILIGHLGRFFHRLALDHFSQRRARRNSAGTAERLEGGIFDDAFVVDLQEKL